MGTRVKVWSVEGCDCRRLVELAMADKVWFCHCCDYVGFKETFVCDDPQLGSVACPNCTSSDIYEGLNGVDHLLPYRVCEHCNHYFFWDDAEGGTTGPGSYLCLACGKET